MYRLVGKSRALGMLESSRVTDRPSRSSPRSPHGYEPTPGRAYPDSVTGTGIPSRAPLHPLLDCSSSQVSAGAMANPTPLSNGFEPAPDVVLRPSGLHLAGKVFKKLMKLKARSVICGSGCFPIECTSRVVMEEHRRRCSSLDVDVERCYDSDEHSAGFVSVGDQAGTPNSSSSMSSASFESLAALSTSCSASSGTPPLAAPASSKSGSQIMANMLLSLTALNNEELLEEDGKAVFQDDEEFLDGPRESAWHQPEEEILNEQEWRMMRYGHLEDRYPVTTTVKQNIKFKSWDLYVATGRSITKCSCKHLVTHVTHDSSSTMRPKRRTKLSM